MVEDAARELNTTLRAEMYYDISMALFDNAYYIWNSQTTCFQVMRDYVKGYYFNPMHAGLYYYHLGLDEEPYEPAVDQTLLILGTGIAIAVTVLAMAAIWLRRR